MGNHASLPIFVDEGVERKSNLSGSALPMAETAPANFDLLLSSPSLKNYLLSNLDSRYLASILFEGCEEGILLKPFKSFRTTSSEEAAAIDQDFSVMNDCAQAGIQVNLSEVISIVERSLEQCSQLQSFPFLPAIQSTLCLASLLPDHLQRQRRKALSMERKRLLADTEALSSAVYPELKPLLGLQLLGLDTLQFLSQHLLASSDNAFLATPVKSYCSSVTRLSKLELFRSWAPRRTKPRQPCDCSSELSSGDGWWARSFRDPLFVEYIQVNWADFCGNSLQPNSIGAPKTVALFIRKAGSSNGEFERLTTISPEEYKEEYGSWQQVYFVQQADVVEVRLVVTNRLSEFNTIGSVKPFEILAFTQEQHLLDDWVDAHSIMEMTQSALLPLFSVPSLEEHAVQASLSVLKATGSLQLCIRFASYLFQHVDANTILNRHEAPFKALLDCIIEANENLRKEAEKEFSSDVSEESLRFIPDNKTGNCWICGDGRLLRVEPGCAAYCFLDLVLSAMEITEWEVEISDCRESISLGLALKGAPVETVEYSKAYLVKCSSGALSYPGPCVSYQHGDNLKPPYRYRLRFDGLRRMLAIACDGSVGFDVIYEHLPSNLSPIVFVQQSSADVSIRMISSKRSKAQSFPGVSPFNSIQPSAPISTYADSSSPYHHLCLLFNAIGDLSRSKMVLYSKQASVEDRQALQDLESPYCLEVSCAVMKGLMELFQQCRNKGLAVNVLTDLLNILELQFCAMLHSRLSLVDLEMPSGILGRNEEAQKALGNDIHFIRTGLLELLQPQEMVDIKLAALKTLCRGSSIVFVSPLDRVEAFDSILRDFLLKDGVDMPVAIKEAFVEGMIIKSREVLDLVRKEQECSDLVVRFLEHLLEFILPWEIALCNDLTMKACFIVSKGVSIFQDLFCKLISNSQNNTTANQPTPADRRALNLFGTVLNVVVKHSTKLLDTIGGFALDNKKLSWPAIEHQLNLTVLGQVLFPTICALSSSAIPLTLIQEALISLSSILESFSKSVSSNAACRESLLLASYHVRRGSVGHEEELSSQVGGWKTVKAVFEDPPDNSFSITDNGTTYTSVHSSNTCAIVPIKFSVGQKAAWEFELSEDSLGDECSIFGAARMPLTSRCYSSSPDLWMRRSYNGFLYCHGQTANATMEKIHPGDMVRIEFDGLAGTLSFSVNGSEPEVGFTDIVDDIYPACGSYRNGVSVKLIKVEVFEKAKVYDSKEGEDLFNIAKAANLAWNYPPDLVNIVRDPLLLFIPTNSKDKRKCSPTSWLTLRSHAAVVAGVHDWAFEFSDDCEGVFALGVTVGVAPPQHDLVLAGQRGCTSNDPDVNYRWEELFNLHELDALGVGVKDNSYFQGGLIAFAWHSDGSLWFNGVKVCQSFGLDALPLRKRSVVVMRLNCSQRSLEFSVNGQFVGIAFGPQELNPACSLSLPLVSAVQNSTSGKNSAFSFHPAASLFAGGMTIKISSAGSIGSFANPLLITWRQVTASVLSRLLARLYEGGDVSKKEKEAFDWLGSPLFIGGVDNHLVRQVGQKEPWLLEALATEADDDRQSVEDCAAKPSFTLTEEEQFLVSLADCGEKPALDDEKVQNLYSRMESLDPEPVFLRQTLEKQGSYRFPSCELPFIACLLKQSGLVKEAIRVVAQDEVPSEDLFLLWQKVKQLRTFLRQRRQKLRVSDDERTHPQSLSEEKTTEVQKTIIGGLSRGSALPYCEDQMIRKAFSCHKVPLWYRQPASCQTVTESIKLDILAFSIDAEKDFAFVIFSVKFINQNWKSQFDSSLSINEVAISNTGTLALMDEGKEKLIVQKFSLASLGVDAWAEGQCKVVFKLNDLEGGSLTLAFSNDDPDTSTFDKLCESIKRRSLLVLVLSSNLQSLDSESRLALLDITSHYSGSTMLFRSQAELSRWKTQERWRRVVDFLRMHSRVRRQLSSEEVDTVARDDTIVPPKPPNDAENHHSLSLTSTFGTSSSSLNIKHDSISNAQAALQACATFVSSDDGNCIAEGLCTIIKERERRASYRKAALVFLGDLVKTSLVVEDPFVLYDLLSAVENFVPSSTFKSTSTEEKCSSLSKESHYLKHLEGCRSETLAQVQQVFSSFYCLITQVTQHYITLWTEKNQSNILSSFEPSSQQSKECHDASSVYPAHLYVHPLMLMLRLWMIHFSTRDFGWIVNSGILAVLYKLASLSFQETVNNHWRQAAENWMQVVTSLRHEGLKCPTSDKKYRTWSPDWEDFGVWPNSLSGSFPQSSPSSASKVYCEVLERCQALLRKEEEEKKQKQSETEAEESKLLQERLSRMADCGMFDPDKKATEIKLHNLNLEASLREDESGTSVCVFANVAYTIAPDADLSSSGNYFEITIIRLGRGDIGVGFADEREFPVTEQMPGWISHSYGYHGDDGKKYGTGATIGDWPTFSVRDVVGCGYNAERKTIFFTINGALLGDGFVNISETRLVPVVGFSNRYDEPVRVKINFGLEPFVYAGEGIITNPNIAVELSRRQNESSSSVSASTSAKADVSIESDVITEQANAKDIDLQTRYCSAIQAIHASEVYLLEANRLQNMSKLVLELFLVLCAKKDSDHQTTSAHLVGSGSESKARPALVKDISIYGTPKVVTSANGVKLNDSILATLMHEITIGAKYLEIGMKESIVEVEEKHLGYTTTPTSSSHDHQDSTRYTLERYQVQEHLYCHLRTLTILVSSNNGNKEALASSAKFLSCIFAALRCGGKVSLSAINILIIIIRDLDPDFVEGCILPIWNNQLQQLEDAFLEAGCRRRSRKMPDSLIRILFLYASQLYRADKLLVTNLHGIDLFCVDVIENKTVDIFGVGTAEMSFYQQAIKLLQRMFEAPQWCELVASTITDTLKNAQAVLDLYIDGENANCHISREKGDNLLLLLACSALSIFHFESKIMPGTEVVVEGSGSGVVVQSPLFDPNVKVVLNTCRREFHCRQHIETVEERKISQFEKPISVDLSHLSQPVLSHITALGKSLLKRALSFGFSPKGKDGLSCQRIDGMVFRLANVLFATLSTLLSRQAEVILEVLHDANMIDGLIQCCKIPTHSPELMSIRELKQKWMFVQARCLEKDSQGHDESLLTNTNDVDVALNNEPAAVSSDQELQPAPAMATLTSDGALIEINQMERAARRDALTALAAEYNVNIDYCVGLAEYFMMDMEKTRAELEKIKDFNGSAIENEGVSQLAPEVNGENNIVSDENPMKGIEFARPPKPAHNLHAPSTYVYRRLLSIKDGSDGGDASKDSGFHRITCGDLVMESDLEGVDHYAREKIATVCHVMEKGKVLVDSFLEEAGFAITELADASVYKKVLFYETETSHFHESIGQLDWTICITAIRSIVLKLLVYGEAMLPKDGPSSSANDMSILDNVSLVKLLVTTGGSGNEDPLKTLCEAFSMIRKPHNPVESVSIYDDAGKALISTLLKDATTSLVTICDSSLHLTSSSTKSAAEDGNVEKNKVDSMMICSSHPYQAPYVTSGKVAFPSSTIGCYIRFHPSSRTASSNAQLKFYCSEEDYLADRPHRRFWGKEGENKFTSFPLVLVPSDSGNMLYYKFEALSNSDFPSVEVASQGNAITASESKISVVRGCGASRVALGEEDTLFNLFNEAAIPVGDDLGVTLWPRGAKLTPGVWRFEVTIQAELIETEADDQQEKVWVGVGAVSSSSEKSLDMASSSPLWAVCSNGTIVMNGTEVGTESKWECDDVIDVIVQISEAQVDHLISFGRNGEWSGLYTWTTGGTSCADKELFPLVTINGYGCKVKVNWGDGKPFQFPVPETVQAYFEAPFRPVVQAVGSKKDNWGYEFHVQPLEDIALELTKSFELVCSCKEEDSLIVCPSSEGSKQLSVWRAKGSDEYCSLGDIITLDGYPPARGVMVHRSQSQPPLSFRCVFYSSKLNIVVWRPTPPEGYVAMGDVVMQGSNTSFSPPLTSTACLPSWAVVPCNIKKRVAVIKKVGESKTITNASLWIVNHGLGFFFGSPFESSFSSGKCHADFSFSGVGDCYKLRRDVEARVAAEWWKEADIISSPSLSWLERLLTTLLSIEKWRPLVLQDFVFFALIKYLKSSLAVSPQRVVPVLISWIRHSSRETAEMLLHSTKNLCKAILTEALTILSKKADMPPSLMLLVDLVVEIQTVHVLESGTKDCNALSRSIDRVKNKWKLFASDNSKEEETHSVVEEKESEELPAKYVVVKKAWWERVTISPQSMKIFRVIKFDNLENVFHKESILLKMKQVLKFLYAISDPPSPTSAIVEKGSRSAILERSYSKLITSKIWYQRASSCMMIESAHPYRESSMKRRVYFPGADKLTVTFDQRTSLSEGDKLIFTAADVTTVYQGPIPENTLTSDLVFRVDDISIEFVPSKADEVRGESYSINAENHWGWGLLVSASGPIYECAEVLFDLSQAIEAESIQLSPGEDDSHSQHQPPFSPSPPNNSSSSGPEETSPGPQLLGGLEDTNAIEDDGAESSSEESTAEIIAAGQDFEGVMPPSNLPLRPRTKRGKRDRNSSLPADEVDNSTPSSTLAEKVPQSETDAKDAEETHLDTDVSVIVSKGVLLKSGSLIVPLASRLEVKISRTGSSVKNKSDPSPSDSFELALCITPHSSDKGSYFRVYSDWNTSIEVVGDRLTYQLWCMSSAAFHAATIGPSGQSAPESGDLNNSINVTPAPVESSAPTLDEHEEEKTTKPDPVSSSEQVQEEDAIVVESGWSCSVCTLINVEEDRTCSACGEPRSAGDGAAATSEGGAGAGWWCPHCTFINNLRATECSMCGYAMSPDPSSSTLPTSSVPSAENDQAQENKESVAVKVSNPEGDFLRISAKGTFNNTARFESRLEAAIISKKQILTPLEVHHRLSTWRRSWDYALLEYLNTKTHRIPGNQRQDSFLTSSEPFAVAKAFLSYQGDCLSHLTLLDINMRAQLLLAFNKALESLLPLVDLNNEDPHSLGAMIRRNNRYMLAQVKLPLLAAALAASVNSSGATEAVSLDNFKALASRDREEKDPSTSQNTFVQCFRQLHSKDPAFFRNSDRVFTITFVGEAGIDAGGVFREGMSRILEDLFSEHFNLFLLSPNGRQAVHSEMDKFVPNPKHTGPLALEMFVFVGKLMGMSLRSNLCLPFDFPPIVWKKLVGEEVDSMRDLMEVDMITAKQIENIEHCDNLPDHEAVLDDVSFQAKFSSENGPLKFVYVGSDQMERELVPGGSRQEVTFENRLDYCRAVRAARLAEFDLQIAAMARGMALVLPMRTLLLFTASELEELVCGSPKIDINMWKSHTESSGLPEDTVELFWKVMESLTPREQSGFIRFAWGRSRLPSREEDFTTNMKLTNAGRAALPVSHTCFFSIEMPEYHLEEQMRHGLLTVIHFGVGGILNG
eukprot:gene6368-7021_t